MEAEMFKIGDTAYDAKSRETVTILGPISRKRRDRQNYAAHRDMGFHRVAYADGGRLCVHETHLVAAQ